MQEPRRFQARFPSVSPSAEHLPHNPAFVPQLRQMGNSFRDSQITGAAKLFPQPLYPAFQHLCILKVFISPRYVVHHNNILSDLAVFRLPQKRTFLSLW